MKKHVVCGVIAFAIGCLAPVTSGAEPSPRADDVRTLPEARGIDQAKLHVENQRAMDALMEAQNNGGVRDHGAGVGHGKGRGGEMRSEKGKEHAGPK